MLRTLQIPSVGGQRNGLPTLDFLGWRSITYQSLVCHIYILQLNVTDHKCITATSVDVERLFSRGRLVLSHTRSRLSVASTHALLCLGSWSLMGLVRDDDVNAVAMMDEVEGLVELDRLADVLKLRSSTM